ncbi:basic proline-rich protein-like [Mustela putorius furo]|uniref:Basic proline-rich protein-like n=1 Tax=Mustela putorius furo TaxID=9669 RepID=A0A8U0S7E2_MUSPF|nr:basic proline-rich protein-like [Mustela putorius furo]
MWTKFEDVTPAGAESVRAPDALPGLHAGAGGSVLLRAPRSRRPGAVRGRPPGPKPRDPVRARRSPSRLPPSPSRRHPPRTAIGAAAAAPKAPPVARPEDTAPRARPVPAPAGVPAPRVPLTRTVRPAPRVPRSRGFRPPRAPHRPRRVPAPTPARPARPASARPRTRRTRATPAAPASTSRSRSFRAGPRGLPPAASSPCVGRSGPRCRRAPLQPCGAVLGLRPPRAARLRTPATPAGRPARRTSARRLPRGSAPAPRDVAPRSPPAPGRPETPPLPAQEGPVGGDPAGHLPCSPAPPASAGPAVCARAPPRPSGPGRRRLRPDTRSGEGAGDRDGSLGRTPTPGVHRAARRLTGPERFLSYKSRRALRCPGSYGTRARLVLQIPTCTALPGILRDASAPCPTNPDVHCAARGPTGLRLRPPKRAPLRPAASSAAALRRVDGPSGRSPRRTVSGSPPRGGLAPWKGMRLRRAPVGSSAAGAGERGPGRPSAGSCPGEPRLRPGRGGLEARSAAVCASPAPRPLLRPAPGARPPPGPRAPPPRVARTPGPLGRGPFASRRGRRAAPRFPPQAGAPRASLRPGIGAGRRPPPAGGPRGTRSGRRAPASAGAFLRRCPRGSPGRAPARPRVGEGSWGRPGVGASSGSERPSAPPTRFELCPRSFL